MEAATSTMQHTFGLGPRGPNPAYGAQQGQGPHQPAPGPSGGQHPEEQHQQHHKPFFYIQPLQPYLPMQSLQWPVPVPMPVSYNPYYSYPGLGYSIPVMPNYQPNPYMEPPGFVVPHTHLHLMDYRRMLNPQYYQTMAYHSRRFRYQHNSQTREMTSSEVQTEPLSATQRTSTPGSSNVEASRALPVHSNHSPGIPTSQPLSPALAVQKGDQSLELKDMVPSSSTRTPPNSSFVIQTEEVRIECCTTPVGLQLLHSHETAEVSHSFSQDMVQCSSTFQGHVLQDEELHLPADQSEQALQACPDILLVGNPSSGEKIPAPEESRDQTDSATVASNFVSQAAPHGDVQETSSEKDLNIASKNFHFKVVHLPFDPKYLDELRKMESTVWSMGETLISSPESLIQSNTESLDETLAADVPSTDVLTMREKTIAEEVVPMIELPPLTEDELEDIVPTVEGPGDEMLSGADRCHMMDVAEESPVTELMHTAEVAHAPYLLLLDNSPLKADRNQHRRDSIVHDHQDTSFESLPAYLPSTSWLADFDNVYYCSKLPPTPKKHNRPLNSRGLDVPSRRRKLDLEFKEPPTVRKPKERYKPKGKVDRRSLSDHECCLSRNFNENAFAPKRERLCTRCLAKRRICTSASPGLESRTLKRKAVPFQQRNDALLPTCEACKSHSKKQPMKKGSSPDVRGRHHGNDTEGESSGNSSCRTGSKWRADDDPRRLIDLKRPLASKQNLEKYPPATYPKLRERNCMCNEPQHQSVGWERLHHCPHGNAIREMDENRVVPSSLQDKWRNMDQIYLPHRWQAEKSWKAMMPNPDSSKNEARSQHLNKHKKSQPQSQGSRRKDTRC
ncbi:uncharacterized protein LOC118327120 [Morone saxatilis]|uniref:uncharacterized protein LOC118327120 n=1 Tax=Morone saxatilis TaxID=34816 RepID=UPI0015E246B2|nr:uncharacterized protein LOC118327120 [Morone saxatilis]